jgi:hypothetical protein
MTRLLQKITARTLSCSSPRSCPPDPQPTPLARPVPSASIPSPRWPSASGIPVWWRLTSLHRPPLPLDAMHGAAAALSAELPVTVEAYLVLPGGEPRSAAPALFAFEIPSSAGAADAARAARTTAAEGMVCGPQTAPRTQSLSRRARAGHDAARPATAPARRPPRRACVGDGHGGATAGGARGGGFPPARRGRRRSRGAKSVISTGCWQRIRLPLSAVAHRPLLASRPTPHAQPQLDS